MSSLHSIELQIGTTISFLYSKYIKRPKTVVLVKGNPPKQRTKPFQIDKDMIHTIYSRLTGIVVSKDPILSCWLWCHLFWGFLIFASEVLWWLSDSWTITVAPCFVTPLLLRRDVLYLASLRCVFMAKTWVIWRPCLLRYPGQEIRSMAGYLWLFHLLTNGVFLGVITHLLTIY